MNASTVALEVVGGLVLFLFGVLQLSRGIEPLAGERARELLSRFTTNPLVGVLTGAVATTILDSSSVAIILVIALVNGGLLTFQQSLGVILGSNVRRVHSRDCPAARVDDSRRRRGRVCGSRSERRVRRRAGTPR